MKTIRQQIQKIWETTNSPEDYEKLLTSHTESILAELVGRKRKIRRGTEEIESYIEDCGYNSGIDEAIQAIKSSL